MFLFLFFYILLLYYFFFLIGKYFLALRAHHRRDSSAFDRSKTVSAGGKLRYCRVRGNWKIPIFFLGNLRTTEVKKL